MIIGNGDDLQVVEQGQEDDVQRLESSDSSSSSVFRRRLRVGGLKRLGGKQGRKAVEVS